MPTSNAHIRYSEALALRDQGATYAEIANYMSYAHAGAARRAVIGGLRLAGRDAEIPEGRAVSFHAGRTTRTVVIENLIGFPTTSSLTFGIEIECIGLTESRAARALTDAGFSCRAEGYTHTVMSTWKVVHDGSLSSRNGSCEVVSPILRGNDGLNEVRSVMKVLRDAGASINVSCGMHIHIGVDNALTPLQQANVISAHQHWQPAFDSLLTLRRTTETRWASRRSRRGAQEIADAWTTPNRIGTGSRYHSLNIAAFSRYGTFEMRSHHGSLNGTNATAWIALHLAFIECVKDDSTILNQSIGNFPLAQTNGWSDHSQQFNDRGHGVDRDQQKVALTTLVDILVLRGWLDSECGTFLKTRASNIPTRSANQ
jgi:hypothetical protein